MQTVVSLNEMADFKSDYEKHRGPDTNSERQASPVDATATEETPLQSSEITRTARQGSLLRQNNSKIQNDGSLETKAPAFKIKDAIADTVAMVVFSTPIAMSVDMIAAGATLQQAAIARLIALPINILSSRPYGKFRDKCFELLKFNKDTPLWQRTIVDSASMVLFQGTLYAGILTASGILSGKPFSAESIGAAAASIVPIMLVIGRPYGWFRNQVRKRVFGLENQD